MISILFLATGIPILILGIIMIGLKKVFELEIVKNIFLRIGKKANKIDKKINSLFLQISFFLLIYIIAYPFIFILMIRYAIVNKTSSNEYSNLILIFLPLLLIWLSGFFYLIDRIQN